MRKYMRIQTAAVNLVGGFIPHNERFSLGSAFAGSGSLASRAQPLLNDLRDRLGESCSLGGAPWSEKSNPWRRQ